MAVVGKYRSGKGSRVTVSATNLNLAEWDATFKGDKIDYVHFECGGTDQSSIGITGADWNLSGGWDAGRNAYDSPPGLYPRDDLGAMKLYTNLADSVFWSIAQSTVLSSRNSANVRQRVDFQASGCSNGGVSQPTGSV